MTGAVEDSGANMSDVSGAVLANIEVRALRDFWEYDHPHESYSSSIV